MKKRQPVSSVFISYCRKDMSFNLLEYFVELLKHESGGAFEVLVDYNELHSGSDLDKYIDRLREADAAIIFLTPGYKKKLEDKDSNTLNLWHEYEIIKDRLLKNKDNLFGKDDKLLAHENRRNFIVRTVLIAGEFSSVVPDEVKNPLTIDLKNINVSKKGESFRIKKIDQELIKKQVNDLARHIESNLTRNDPDYEEKWNEMFDLLLQRSKSEWRKEEYRPYLEPLFVKTRTFKKVQRQKVWFLVGRKGSGKSTITDVLPILQEKKYSFTIPIYAEHINLNIAYNFFDSRVSANASFYSSTKHIYDPMTLLKSVWEGFLFLSCMYEVTNKKNIFLTIAPVHLSRLKKFIDNIIRDDAHNSENNLSALFYYSFTRLYAFVESNVSKIRADYFASDLVALTSNSRYREYLIPADVIKSFQLVIKEMKGKILLTFDGIDTLFDSFRRDGLLSNEVNQDEVDRRSRFETSWLGSLILLILDNGVNGRDELTKAIFGKLHYCITIPKDRFLEIHAIWRDAYRLQGKYASLNWTGIELCIFIRKRLELLENTFSEEKSLKDRLENVMKDRYPEVPLTIEYDFNGEPIDLPLFLYVLRFTFWRPRDILFYYASIITIAKESRKKKKKLDSNNIRYLIELTTEKVIKSEFITEFDITTTNIKGILNAFRGSKQILDFQSLSGILAKVEFGLSAIFSPDLSIENKIRYLYHTGFLGIVIDESKRNRYKEEFKYAFIFNEDEDVMHSHDFSDLMRSEFVIHPIFCRYLDLNKGENPELVSNYTWPYLEHNETRRSVV